GDGGRPAVFFLGPAKCAGEFGKAFSAFWDATNFPKVLPRPPPPRDPPLPAPPRPRLCLARRLQPSWPLATPRAEPQQVRDLKGHVSYPLPSASQETLSSLKHPRRLFPS